MWDALPEDGRAGFLDVVKRFEEANPNIKVEVYFVPGGYEAILERALTAYAGGSPPNIVHLAHVHSYHLKYNGVLMELDKYIEQDPTFDIDDWYPAMIDIVRHDGKIYGVPYNVSTPINLVNLDLLQLSGLPARAPATWDEVVEFGRVITRDTSGDGEPDIWATDITRRPSWDNEMFVMQAGGQFASADGRELLLNSPESVAAWEFTQMLVRERIARYPGAPRADFVGGKVGWWIRSTASLKARIAETNEVGMNMEVAFLPCGVTCHVPIGGGSFHAFNWGSQAEKDAAYKFLSFIAEPENLAWYAGNAGYMAGRRSAVLTDFLQSVFREDPRFRVTYEQLVNGMPEAGTRVPEWHVIQGMLAAQGRGNFLDEVYYNLAPVRPLLDDITRRGNAVIAEYFSRAESR